MASGSSRSDNAAEIDRLALALAKEPGSKAFIPLAEEYGKAGMWQEAAAVLEDGLKAYPNFITAMVALGRTYDQLNQPVKAKAILEEAVKLSPENLRAHRTLAKIYLAEGANEAALRSCGVILSVNAHDEEALSIRAAIGPARSAGPATSPPSPAPAIKNPHSAKLERPPQPAPTAELPSRDDENRSTVVDQACTSPAPSAASPQSSSAAVHRLERWLASIQVRRRDRSPSNHPSAP